ncbi:unnamed protein product [Calypogeia fissa]
MGGRRDLRKGAGSKQLKKLMTTVVLVAFMMFLLVDSVDCTSRILHNLDESDISSSAPELREIESFTTSTHGRMAQGFYLSIKRDLLQGGFSPPSPGGGSPVHWGPERGPVPP